MKLKLKLALAKKSASKINIRHAVFCGIGFIVVIEFLAGLAGLGRPLLYRSSEAGYELQPNQRIVRGKAITTVNTLGTRGDERHSVPSAGTTRILVLGDSVAAGGTQISDGQTWPALLEKSLLQSGKSIEVLNASAGGWSLENEFKWIKKHGLLGAHVLILSLNESDLDQEYVSQEILDKHPSFPSKNPKFALEELLFRYIGPKLFSIKNEDPGSTAKPFNELRFLKNLELIVALHKLIEVNDAKLIVMYWPREAPSSEAIAKAKEKLLAHLKSLRVDVILPEQERRQSAAYYYRDDIHPSQDGNEHISSVIASHLRKKSEEYLVSKK